MWTGTVFRDVDLSTRTANGNQQDVSFIAPQDTYNVMAYGEYTFEGDMNITPFFELLYSRAEVSVENSGTGQFFPWVPSSNAFSPCNISTRSTVYASIRTVSTAATQTTCSMAWSPARPSTVRGCQSALRLPPVRSPRSGVIATMWKPCRNSIVACSACAVICPSSGIAGALKSRASIRARKVRRSVAASAQTGLRSRWASIPPQISTVTAWPTMTATALPTIISRCRPARC